MTKTKNYKNYFIIFLTIIFIISIAIIFIIPYNLNSKSYISFNEFVSRTYGEINLPKTLVLMFLNLIILLSSIFFIHKIYNNKKLNKKIYISLVVILSLLWSLFFVLITPQHAALNLYSYGNVKNPTEPEQFINFLGVGDIQEFGNNDDQESGDRYKRSEDTIKNINKTLCQYPDDYFQGLITPGDCTQTGEDGRSFTHNYLADYESRFGLGTLNSIPIQVYECTGNHDWDSTEEIYPRMKYNYSHFENPTVKMIKRKNKYRYGITATDDYGNYEWQWKTKKGKYNFIGLSLNIGVTDKKLYSGRPINSINFLKERIKLHNSPNDRFFILTHWYEDDFKNYVDCFGDKLDQIRGIFIGHWHVPELTRLSTHPINTPMNNLFRKIYVLPSPTVSKGDIAIFKYDTIYDYLDANNYPYWKSYSVSSTSSVGNEKLSNLDTSDKKSLPNNINYINYEDIDKLIERNESLYSN